LSTLAQSTAVGLLGLLAAARASFLVAVKGLVIYVSLLNQIANIKVKLKMTWSVTIHCTIRYNEIAV